MAREPKASVDLKAVETLIKAEDPRTGCDPDLGLAVECPQVSEAAA